jgi:beta-galactosidase
MNTVPSLLFGSAWYPEQRPESTWEQDLSQMQKAGLNTVRMGEFAWSDMEPTDGHYTFEWVQRAIEKAAQYGISTILCTPTPCVPAWLAHKYPHIMGQRANGTKQVPGIERQHFDPSEPQYLIEVARIAGALAKRFGDHPSVIGWQLDNEIGESSWSPSAAKRFQAWLQHRYGTLDNLNRKWGTAVWSGRFESWQDIPLKARTHVVHLDLAIFDWQDEVWEHYLKVQADAIRQHRRRPQPISHNFTYDYARQDAEHAGRSLDIMGIDPYVSPLTRHHPDRMGFYLAITRGAKRAPFWVLETQPNTTGWAPPNAALPPGEVRRLMYHQIGHGANLVSFWQWRASRTGTEQYHGSLVHSDGRPRPILAEITGAVRELNAIRSHLAGTTVNPKVAMLWRTRDRLHLDRHRFHPDFDPWKNAYDQYGAFRRLGLDVEVIGSAKKLEDYRLLIAPYLHLVDAELEQSLTTWVQSGGHLLMGPRSGWADEEGARRPDGQPGGLLARALGVRVEEYYALTSPLGFTSAKAGNGEAHIWAEWLEPETSDCQVLARYDERHPWLSGRAAWVQRTHGQGRISYLGCWPNESLWTQIALASAQQASVELPWVPLPKGMEVHSRQGPQGNLYILCNYNESQVRVVFPKTLIDLSENKKKTSLSLPAFGVAILWDAKPVSERKRPTSNGHA